MKINNKAVFVILLATFSIFGCSKDSLHSGSDIAQLSDATKQAISSGRLKLIKQSYSMLSTDEQQLLWNTKLNAILDNDKSKLTTDQRKIINSIKALVDKNTFAKLRKNPKDGEDFLKSNLSYFQKHFSNPQLLMLIECPYFCDNFSIFNSNIYLNTLDLIEDTGDGGGGSGGGGLGSRCNCFWSLSCWVGFGSCITGGCGTVTECGLFNHSNCTGRCS